MCVQGYCRTKSFFLDRMLGSVMLIAAEICTAAEVRCSTVPGGSRPLAGVFPGNAAASAVFVRLVLLVFLFLLFLLSVRGVIAAPLLGFALAAAVAAAAAATAIALRLLPLPLLLLLLHFLLLQDKDGKSRSTLMQRGGASILYILPSFSCVF